MLGYRAVFRWCQCVAIVVVIVERNCGCKMLLCLNVPLFYRELISLLRRWPLLHAIFVISITINSFSVVELPTGHSRLIGRIHTAVRCNVHRAVRCGHWPNSRVFIKTLRPQRNHVQSASRVQIAINGPSNSVMCDCWKNGRSFHGKSQSTHATTGIDNALRVV